MLDKVADQPELSSTMGANSMSRSAALIDEYRAMALAHGSTQWEDEDDVEAGNKAAARIAEIICELRSSGPASHSALLSLLDDADPHVRSWAGTHALEIAPERAERALEQLAADRSLSGMISFNARMVLREWHQGNLRFP